MRTLVIEDSESSRGMIRMLLERRGHVVTAVGDAESGLAAHEAAPFDLLVVDWFLPAMSGLELCRRVRALPGGDEAVILMVTGRSDTQDLAAVFEAGATDFLRKPIDAAQLEVRLLVAERQVREGERRRRAQEASRRSEETFRTLIENAPDAILVHRDDVLLYVNPRFVQLLGHRSEQDIAGGSVLELCHPDDREAVLAVRRDLVEKGVASDPFQVRLRRPDGTFAVTEAVGMVVTFDGAQAVLVMFRDVTERHEMQARMMAADRMASVGNLAAGVAHELNNPLAYVLSNIRMLGEELDASEGNLSAPRRKTVRELVEESVHGIERMRLIVRDLKTFARIDDEDHQSLVKVDQLVDSCVGLCRNEIRHRGRLDKRLDPAPSVRINESRLAQVVLNLLINAAQALPEQRGHANRVTVRTGEHAGGAVIEVEDNGEGISPDRRHHIFDPFYTTKSVGEGTGLGLSICHNIVTAAGGDISLESTPGKGSTFRVWLPMADAPPKSVPRTPVPPSKDSSAKRRLLVVDDEPLVGRALRRVLRGCEVSVVSSGREAVDLLTRKEASYDLILCDLMMPEMSGMDVYHTVAETHPDRAARFVFMTGGAFTPAAREFLDRVGNDRIEKPFDPYRLRELVK
ncbi:MAG: response regulator [Myxococcota bacterium]